MFGIKNTKLKLNPEWFKQILDTTKDAVIVINSEGNVIYVNKEATNMFGFSEEELMGKPVIQIMPDRYKDVHTSSMTKVSNDHSNHNHIAIGTTRELIALNKAGEEFPIELSLAEKKIGDKFYFIAAIRDISKRVKATEGMKESLKKVEDMNKFMVGRELRIKELKEELAQKK